MTQDTRIHKSSVVPTEIGTSHDVSSSGSTHALASRSAGSSADYEILNQIFQRTAFKGPTEGPLSDAMKGAFDHTANTGGAYRGVVDFWSNFESNPPIRDDFLRPMLGMTTAGYFPIAVLGTLKAYEKMQLANRIGDIEGERLAQLELGSKLTTAIGGAFFTMARPLSIASSLAGISASSFIAPSTLGKVTYAMGTLGGWLFGCTSLIGGIRSSLGLHEVRMFDQKLQNCQTEAEKIALLESSVHADINDVYKMLKDKYEKQFSGYEGTDKRAKISRAIKDELVQEAVLKGAEELHEMLAELSKEPGSSIQVLSVEECKKLIDQMKNRQLGYLPQSQAQQMLRNALCMQGLGVMMSKLQMKKEMEMSRILTPECVKMIKEKQDPKLILEKVNKAIHSSKKTHILNLTLAVLGVLTTIAAIFITGGGWLIALGIVSLVSTFGGFAVDARGFVKELKSGTPGRHDKLFLMVNVAVAVTCFSIGIVLMCSLGQFALIPFLFGLLILLTWTGAHAYAWKRINENEKKQKAENPTLSYFVESLKQERSRDKIRALFFKLPKAERNGIEEHLLRHHPKQAEFGHDEVVEAAKAYLHHVELVEKEKKKQLMISLKPIMGRFRATQAPALV